MITKEEVIRQLEDKLKTNNKLVLDEQNLSTGYFQPYIAKENYKIALTLYALKEDKII